MRLYLDLCCFNRPFDDQGQLIIRLQTEAKLAVQRSIHDGLYELVWSPILDFENAANPDQQRSEAISQWREIATVDIETDEMVERTAASFVEVGLGAMDALHLASAVHAKANIFLTTDKAIIRKMRHHAAIKVLDPYQFLELTENRFDED